jgi:uncharacterized protein
MDSSLDVFERVIARLTGPMRLRFIVLPVMAIILGIRDGVHDAREGQPAFLWHLFRRPETRARQLKKALKQVMIPLIVAILLDAVVQYMLFRRIRLVGAVTVGTTLMGLPYLLARGITNRVVSAHSHSSSQPRLGGKHANFLDRTPAGCIKRSVSKPMPGTSQAVAIWPRNAPSSFHVLAKPTGAICNLDCKYCFFLSKDALYPGSKFRMADDTLEAYVRQMIESQQSPHVTIAWQGGEPTMMGLDFYRHASALAHKYLRRGMTLEQTIQTNGILLDDSWCEFLRENGFLVGLSLDGPQAMHDTYRVDKAGAPTFARVMRAARLMQQHKVEFNVLCTVHDANANRPLELYRFFRDEVRTKFIQLIPIVERATPETVEIANAGWGDGNRRRPLYTQDGELVTARSVKPAQWGQFLVTVFDEWVAHDVGRVFIQSFESALAAWLDLPASLCIFGETCGNALALEHNGDVYSCDHFVEPRFRLGNIKEEHLLQLVASQQQRAFGNAKRDSLPRYCRECAVRFACNGECPRNRFLHTPDGEPGLNYLCAGYKTFFHHIDRPMRVMASLLRNGQDPAGVMQARAPEYERLRIFHSP